MFRVSGGAAESRCGRAARLCWLEAQQPRHTDDDGAGVNIDGERRGENHNPDEQSVKLNSCRRTGRFWERGAWARGLTQIKRPLPPSLMSQQKTVAAGGGR